MTSYKPTYDEISAIRRLVYELKISNTIKRFDQKSSKNCCGAWLNHFLNGGRSVDELCEHRKDLVLHLVKYMDNPFREDFCNGDRNQIANEFLKFYKNQILGKNKGK